MSEVTTNTGELNALWAKMLAHRSVIRSAMIGYAVGMNVDESEKWKNPLRTHLDEYDESLLRLQRDMTNNVVFSHIQTFAPNIEIDSESVLDRMVDAKTDENSETTMYDKPLVFDAQWISEYLHKNYFENKEEIAYKQLVSRVYHLIGNFELKGNEIVFPFYRQRWFNDQKRVSPGSQKLVEELDRLIQVVLYGGLASCNKPKILKQDSAQETLQANVKLDLSNDSAEATLRFENEEQAKQVADAILATPK